MSNYPEGVTYKNFNESEEEVLKCKCCETIYLESELNGHQRCDECEKDFQNENGMEF